MYRLIGTKTTRAMRVLWTLEELGLPYAHDPLPPRHADVLLVNPSGKVPVLMVDGVALSDSVAIMTFLADKHGALTFPAGTIERAQQDGLTQMITDELDAILWTAARHSFVLPEDRRMPEIKEPLRWEWDRNLARLSERLGKGPYLMGETLTIADLLCAHCLGWAQSAKFTVDQPNLLDYLARMRARPSWQRLTAKTA